MPSNRLYLLKRHKDQVDWEEYYGFVVRATTPSHARELAAAEAYSESVEWAAWLDPKATSCTLLRQGGKARVVLASNKGA